MKDLDSLLGPERPPEFRVFTRDQLTRGGAAKALNQALRAGKHVLISDRRPGRLEDLPYEWTLIAARIVLGGRTLKDRWGQP